MYRSIWQAEKDEKHLASQLSRLRPQLMPDELQELAAITASGQQLLVDTVELFVKTHGRFPVDPPLSVQAMLPETLSDESRDWSLAHEEMRLAQQLASLRQKRDLAEAQQEQLILCDPVRVDALQDVLNRLLEFCVGADSQHIVLQMVWRANGRFGLQPF